ncbi:MAG: hypothetical protein K1X88_34230 [Nannocystaceae bacterium]|nr:hypothetical protein [Nannocystaceae bacterium]
MTAARDTAGRDALAFVVPGIVTAAIAIAIGVGSDGEAALSTWQWVVLVLVIDVAHVWATIFRTYLDPSARRRHARRLWLLPALCGWLGFLLHLENPAWFWTLLAYLAIFHFVMQHVGFATLFARKRGESEADRRLIKAAVFAGTLGPVLWWHGHLPRSFAWFQDGDLFEGLPAALGTAALALELPVWGWFLLRRAALARAGRANPMVLGLVLVPALNWHLGIVVFDDDRIFTLTNVVMHGVPYVALVWRTGGRTHAARLLARWRGRASPVALVAAAYLGLLVLLAALEEAAWDRWIWHDHPQLFGDGSEWALAHPVATAAVVALLTVPQATHYLLDRYIWRAGPDNPELAEALGLR